MSSYELIQGSQPLLISMPHNGTKIPADIADKMTNAALQVPDTDWYLDRLYDFAEAMGVSLLKPEFSRYVIDLNRDPGGAELYPGADNTELCPTTRFDYQPLYKEGMAPDREAIGHRVNQFWQPYHSALAEEVERIKKEHGRVILFEAHSIASQVPRFFEGSLPDFNFGTSNGATTGSELEALLSAFDSGAYSKVMNQRFKGGFITRHYAAPEMGVETVQLELSQITYMDESTLEFSADKARSVQPILNKLIDELLAYLSK